ncbi:hypothetical protein PR048_002679 [Dryococelus australis]|uniref:Uncharacterized protein n=1 Tax=Dryococelus australis TaxID=614101 RepID=A0ABQ9IKW3_9NEOP|nr:hypothetical protein PR048_002679 [Dryococelus australis]
MCCPFTESTARRERRVTNQLRQTTMVRLLAQPALLARISGHRCYMLFAHMFKNATAQLQLVLLDAVFANRGWSPQQGHLFHRRKADIGDWGYSISYRIVNTTQATWESQWEQRISAKVGVNEKCGGRNSSGPRCQSATVHRGLYQMSLLCKTRLVDEAYIVIRLREMVIVANSYMMLVRVNTVGIQRSSYTVKPSVPVPIPNMLQVYRPNAGRPRSVRTPHFDEDVLRRFRDSVIGPYMFPAQLNLDWYLAVLLHVLPELLKNIPHGTRQEMWLQHDCAPPHFGAHVREYLHTTFAGRWIACGGPRTTPGVFGTRDIVDVHSAAKLEADSSSTSFKDCLYHSIARHSVIKNRRRILVMQKFVQEGPPNAEVTLLSAVSLLVGRSYIPALGRGKVDVGRA